MQIHHKACLFFVLFFCSFVAKESFATIRYVKASATGANNGSDWTNAYTNLQSALAASSSPDEIWVAAGNYFPSTSGDRSASFVLKPGVKLYGGFSGTPGHEGNFASREGLYEDTVLSGDLLGNDELGFVNYAENSYHVLRASSVSSSAVLDGFFISAGNANGTSEATLHGGGFYITDASSPTIRNCFFVRNRADSDGAGLYRNASGNLTVETSQFRENEALGRGAGLFFSHNAGQTAGNLTIRSSRFDCNRSPISAKGGGGAYANVAQLKIKDSVFEGNYAAPWGGAMTATIEGEGTIVNCHFDQNEAEELGGALRLSPAQTTSLINCRFYGNQSGISSHPGSSGFGGAIYTEGEDLRLVNCTLAQNHAVTDGSAIYYQNHGASTSIQNTIVWGNSTQVVNGKALYGSSSVQISYSCLQENVVGGIGNLFTDPFFVDLNNGNLNLQSISSGLDAGDDAALPADILDIDADGNVGEVLPIDLEGTLRKLDHPVDGSGAPLVDMDAYERSPNFEAPNLTAVGCRYLKLEVPQGDLPVSLRVEILCDNCAGSKTGYVGTPSVTQNVAYLVNDSSQAAWLTPAQWNAEFAAVFVTGPDVVPHRNYSASVNGGTQLNPELSPASSIATTWIWTDTDNNGTVNLADILAILAAFGGNFPPSGLVTFYSCSLIGAAPNNPDAVINLSEILAVLAAFGGTGYTEPDPCN